MLNNTFAGVKKDVSETVTSAREFVARVFAATPAAVRKPVTFARELRKLPATVATLNESVNDFKDDMGDFRGELASLEKDIENLPSEDYVEREVERQISDAMEDRDFTRNIETAAEEAVREWMEDDRNLADALESALPDAIRTDETVEEMQEKAEATDIKVAKLLGQLNILLASAGLKTLDANGDVVEPPKAEAMDVDGTLDENERRATHPEDYVGEDGVTRDGLKNLLDKFAEVRDGRL